MKHDSSVEAASLEGNRGARFTIRLPACMPGTVDGPESEDESSPCTVLLVEDNADARVALATLLRLEGHEVIEAADGYAALDVINQKPDVALVDLGLPGIDGFQLGSELRARVPEMVLIALSGYGSAEDVERAHQVGYRAHLVKPASIEEIRNVIAELVGRGI